jgi:hypothetical protein
LRISCSPNAQQDIVALNWTPARGTEQGVTFEWVLENLANGQLSSGTTRAFGVDVRVQCSYPPTQYRWRVRTISTQGLAGAFSESWRFSAELWNGGVD